MHTQFYRVSHTLDASAYGYIMKCVRAGVHISHTKNIDKFGRNRTMCRRFTMGAHDRDSKSQFLFFVVPSETSKWIFFSKMAFSYTYTYCPSYTDAHVRKHRKQTPPCTAHHNWIALLSNLH